MVAALPTPANVVAVHGRNDLKLNLLRTRTRALANVGAAAKALRVHLCHHAQRAMIPLRFALRQYAEVRNLRAGK